MEPLSHCQAREVVALAAVGMWSLVAWHSVLGVVARGHVHLSGEGALHDVVPPLVWLTVSSGAAVYIIRETGLLALVRRRTAGRQTADRASRSDWWRWLAHFRLSLAALSVTCVAAWLARVELLLWLIGDPYAAGSRTDAPWYFCSPAERTQTEVLLVVATAWIVAVPFLASDAWGLLFSRWNQRAARLQVPFALVTGLAALGVLAMVREWAQGWLGLPFGAAY